MSRHRLPFITDRSESHFTVSILVSVFFGLAAGAVGMLLAFAYGDMWSVAPTPQTYVPASAGTVRSVVELPSVPEQNISRSVVVLYPSTASVVRDYGTFDLASDAMGAGIVLTSDGWVISHERALSSSGKAPEIAVIAGRSYPVDTVVTDPYSGIVFLKLDASNLPVTPFGKEADLTAGDQLFGFDADGGVRRLEVTGTDTVPESSAADIVRPSERMQRVPRLAPVAGMLPGTVLTDAKGEVVAVYGGEDGVSGGHAVPIGSFLRQVSAVLRDGAVSRPYLGVHYADLSRAVDADSGKDVGALLAASPDGRQPAVSPGSPAAAAGLRAGDILMAVNGERVTSANTLPELLMQYAPGDMLTLTVDRNDRSITAEVTLGSLVKKK